MITGITRFKLRPGMTRQDVIEDIRRTIPVYKDRPGLVRKYICIDFEARTGCGVYLWSNREAAEKFYEFARPIIREQTGSDPDITLFETPVVVDNDAGTMDVYD